MAENTFICRRCAHVYEDSVPAKCTRIIYSWPSLITRANTLYKQIVVAGASTTNIPAPEPLICDGIPIPHPIPAHATHICKSCYANAADPTKPCQNILWRPNNGHQAVTKLYECSHSTDAKIYALATMMIDLIQTGLHDRSWRVCGATAYHVKRV